MIVHVSSRYLPCIPHAKGSSTEPNLVFLQMFCPQAQRPRNLHARPPTSACQERAPRKRLHAFPPMTSGDDWTCFITVFNLHTSCKGLLYRVQVGFLYKFLSSSTTSTQPPRKLPALNSQERAPRKRLRALPLMTSGDDRTCFFTVFALHTTCKG